MSLQPPAKEFKALPDRPVDDPDGYDRCLAELARVLTLDVPAEATRRDLMHAIFRVARRKFPDGTALPAESFDLLVECAVREPDPSANRWFVEPALNAFGRRRVQVALLGRLLSGPDPQRAGAARAWYWSRLPIRCPHLMASGDPAQRAAADASGDVVQEWHTAALLEFVRNDDTRVRQCILPLLSLKPSVYPPALAPAVEAAIAIARGHHDAYIRHRVEVQVR